MKPDDYLERWANAVAGTPGLPVEPLLTRDVERDERRLPHVPGIAIRDTGLHAGRAPTTRDARHSEGNYQSYIDDLKRRMGPGADQPHRVAYKKLVRAQVDDRCGARRGASIALTTR